MTPEQEKIIFNNVLNDKDGFQFVLILLEKLGAYERGCNFQNRDLDMFNRGRREAGLWLADKIQEYCLEKYKDIVIERKNLWKMNNKQQS